MANDDSNWMAH